MRVVKFFAVFMPTMSLALPLFPQSAVSDTINHNSPVLLTLLFLILITMLITVWQLYGKIKRIREMNKIKNDEVEQGRFKKYINTMDSKQIEEYLRFRKQSTPENKTYDKSVKILGLLLGSVLLGSNPAFSQSVNGKSVLGEGGIIITLILISIPILGGIILSVVKILNAMNAFQDKKNREEGERLAEYLRQSNSQDVDNFLAKRKEALDYTLTHNELSGQEQADDRKGLLIGINPVVDLPVVATKKRASLRHPVDPALSKLIIWFILTATFWLLFGTTVGEYVGMKFVSPDLDQLSWLSFGRLRPVHTNAVFWGWSSLGMLALGYYVVPRVGNSTLASIRMGWWTLILINVSVFLGSIFLMAGINNGGGEFREYIWPVQLLFGIALILTLINFLRTIAQRKTKEIYISNWYMVAAVMFAIIITIVAYVPLWQDGLGETIIQGYYMHQGVGMWFMLFTLGIVYYFLPQQLNKPIYSYSLGILAFWTQILFYTVIGTHHFVFSSIPWWLQTTAIVGSMGMVIPVVAGSANFLLTFNGAWYKVSSSYTLPFFLVGVIFYFTGSLQGTAEAFRSTNLIWHFTDFTVAHSHLTMYGIICFFLWAGIYALVPRLTGKEAPQITVGAHFWLALIGLLFYTIPLMYGGTLKGLMWIEGKPFIDSVVFMAPYWLWRAIGGSLMWLSHLFFAYNIYKMMAGGITVDVREAAIEKLNQAYSASDEKL